MSIQTGFGITQQLEEVNVDIRRSLCHNILRMWISLQRLKGNYMLKLHFGVIIFDYGDIGYHIVYPPTLEFLSFFIL